MYCCVLGSRYPPTRPHLATCYQQLACLQLRTCLRHASASTTWWSTAPPILVPDAQHMVALEPVGLWGVPHMSSSPASSAWLQQSQVTVPGQVPTRTVDNGSSASFDQRLANLPGRFPPVANILTDEGQHRRLTGLFAAATGPMSNIRGAPSERVPNQVAPAQAPGGRSASQQPNITQGINTVTAAEVARLQA